jgi:hypothetical protein
MRLLRVRGEDEAEPGRDLVVLVRTIEQLLVGRSCRFHLIFGKFAPLHKLLVFGTLWILLLCLSLELHILVGLHLQELLELHLAGLHSGVGVEELPFVVKH